jgi:gliding motility-associated-like protein
MSGKENYFNSLIFFVKFITGYIFFYYRNYNFCIIRLNVKAIGFLLLVLALSQILYAQNPNFAWAKQSGGIDNDEGNSIAVDATGNVYITGLFGGSSANTGNAFVSKYNTSGILLWTKQFIGTHSYGKSITIDVSGNVLLTGIFDGIVDFDPGSGVFNLTATSDDQFISKLDAAGNFIWAMRIGGTVYGQNVFVSSIVTDVLGNVYTSGSFEGPTIDFDPGPGVYVFSSGEPWPEIFVSKLDASGNFVWAKQMEEVGVGFAFHGSWANSIAVDAVGNVYTTGRFANQIDFDPGPGVFYLYHTTDNCDAFISKLDAAGNFVWAKQLKGQTPDAAVAGSSIVLDASGNIYTAGVFTDSVDFDPGPGTFYLNSPDGYLSKLDAAGNFISAKSFVAGFSTTLDVSGNIYTVGAFSGTTDFDPGTGTFTLTSIGITDVFITKSDNSVNFVWAIQIGGAGAQARGYSIVLDALRNIYTTGHFNSTVDFDPGTATYNLTSVGSYDIFVHKMSQCINVTSCSITASACSTYTLNGQTYTATGIYTQTLINAAGCDSIITLNLTINNRYTTINATACNSYTWNGQSYTSTGAYRDTLPAANGCDSIITLELVINSTSFSVISAAICPGQNYAGYISAGTYLDTLVSTNGCDSIRTLNLTIKSRSLSTIDTSICLGKNYAGYTATGTYTDILVAANGCDSVRTLNLTIKSNCDINIPNAFTPNGDTKNDIFSPIILQAVKAFSFIVFNRYGQTVFETREYGKGWDGTLKGKKQPMGSYVYRIKYTNIFEVETIENGSVLLIR